MRSRFPAVLLWTAVVLQVLLVALGVVFDALARPGSSGFGFALDAVTGAASILTFPAVGALVFWRRPEHPIGWLFCCANLGWAINNFAGPYARYALVVDPGSVSGGRLAAWFYTWPGAISTGLLLLLFLLFPDGRPLSSRWRPVAWSTLGYAFLGAVALAFAPGPVDDTIGFEVDNPAGIGGPLGHVLRPLADVVQPLAVPLLVVALVSLALRQRRSGGQERQQLKWFTSSLILFVVLVGADTAFFLYYGSQGAQPGWASTFNDVAISSDVLIPIAAGVAILRYRLYDIDVLINKTLVYGALTASLVLVYFGGVVLLQQVFRALTGQGSDLAIVASTLAIAALFDPVRHRVQDLVDRRFFRKKYDAARTLEAFGARLRNETDLEALNGGLVEVVRETMQPERVSLWMRPQTGADPKARRGR
jgi:hypothetical protein